MNELEIPMVSMKKTIKFVLFYGNANVTNEKDHKVRLILSNNHYVRTTQTISWISISARNADRRRTFYNSNILQQPTTIFSGKYLDHATYNICLLINGCCFSFETSIRY